MVHKRQQIMKGIVLVLCQVFFLVSPLIVYSVSAKGKYDVELSLEELKSGIFLPVTINETPYTFLLDTGSTFTVLNSSFKPILGEPLALGQAETPVGQSSVQFYQSIDVMTGEINIKTKLPFLIADLDFFSKVIGEKFDGIAGMAFIHDYIWDIDFDNNIVRILSELDNPPSKNKFSGIKMSSSPKGVPLVPVEIAGKMTPFMLDTGDTGSGRLTTEMIDSLSKNNLIENIAWDSSVNVSGISKIRRVRVREMKVGSHTYNGLLMQESIQNALGLGFLNRHHVIMDFPNQQLYLKKGLGSFHVDRLDKSGIKLINDNGQLIVALVDARGPAKSAGIQKEDIIRSVNKTLTSGEDLLRVREIFKENDGEEIFLAINRNGKEINFSFVLNKNYNFLMQ